MANFFFISGNQNLKKKILLKMSDNKFYKCGNLRPDDQKSNTMLSIKNGFFLYFFSCSSFLINWIAHYNDKKINAY